MTTSIVFVGPIMFFSILLCLSLTSFVPVCYASSTEETGKRYECGAHGKFEYCIDDIPGCVIGCHCHPGYYFDTDTKICEPNTKLVQDFRRRYMAEPTRVYPVNTPTAVVEHVPTPTTTSGLDEKIDEIAKDTDDIGDWLFNQFFKTIETQVINNTNDEQQALTRRSGLDVYRPVGPTKHGGGHKSSSLDLDQIKSKTRKSWKGRGKKNKSKVHGLRRKLLRITEDDSLFDSESEEDSSGGDSSDGSSSSGSSSSSEDSTKERKKEGINNNKNDREHGHKKVIIFNRRPRPPLPSFIFLPSMDTPYYPPIGLPPPPVLPMYPMVPVPPMAPFIPFLETKNESSTTTEASKSTDGGDDESTTTTEATEATAESEPPAVRSDVAAKHSDRRTRPKGHKPRIQIPKMDSEETFMIRAKDTPPRIPITSKHAERMKLVQKLRQRLKKKNKLPPIQDNTVVDADEESPLFDDTAIAQDSVVSHITRKQSRHETERDQVLNDVNFKYITELIHRANLNQTDPPPASVHPKPDLKQVKNIPNTRRNDDPLFSNAIYPDETALHNKAPVPKPEDAYFTKLGRQIASLVRNVESQLDNNAANEQNYKQKQMRTVLQQNITPRLFWERSVRSPLTRFKNYFDRLHFEKHSGEKNLFSLENEVKTLATTVAPLSLQDLENILSTLQKAHEEINKSKKSTDQTNGSFNVNLLPNKPVNAETIYRKRNGPLDYAEYYPRTKHLTSTTNISRDFASSNATHYIEPTNLDLPMIDDWMFNSQDFKQTINSNQQPAINKSLERENSKYSAKSPIPFYKKITKQKDYRLHHTKPLLAHTDVQNYEPFAKYYETPVNHPALHPKYLEQPVKNHEPTVKIPEHLVKYPEWIAQYAELSAKYPEMTAKYRELLTKYPELPTKFPELLGKHPEMTTKYSNLPEKSYPDIPIKYPMQPVKFPPKPALVNYKSMDYFTDAENKRHYTFEATYPLQIPSYRRRFSKRFENDSGKKSSYFHHELHHFDYID